MGWKGRSVKVGEASHVIYAAADGGANTQMTGIYFEGTDSGVSLAALDGQCRSRASASKRRKGHEADRAEGNCQEVNLHD